MFIHSPLLHRHVYSLSGVGYHTRESSTHVHDMTLIVYVA